MVKRKRMFEKEIKEGKYQRKIFEALLFSSVEGNNLRLPTIEEFILSEVINGTIDYVGGNGGNVNFQRYAFDRNNFEKELIKYFEKELRKTKKFLNPRIKIALKDLTAIGWVLGSGHSSSYPTCKLYDHFLGGICQVTTESSFSLPQELIIRVRKEILPSLSKTEKEDVEGIGKAMRKYITEDLEYIKEDYHW